MTGAAKYPEGIIEELEQEHTVYKINAMEEAEEIGKF